VTRIAENPRQGRDRKNGQGSRSVIVTELPYQVQQGASHEHLAASLVNDKSSRASPKSADESDRDGMRVVFELKRGEQAEVVLKQPL